MFLRKLDDLTDPNTSIGGNDSLVRLAYIAPFAVRAVELGGDAHKGITLFNSVCFGNCALLLLPIILLHERIVDSVPGGRSLWLLLFGIILRWCRRET